MSENRVLILTGGCIFIDFLRKYLEQERFHVIIAVDRGMVAAKELNLPVNYLVGDFDSVSSDVLDLYKREAEQNRNIIIKEYNPQKDATDTQIGIELGVSLDPTELVIIGATGTRVDHMLCNIQLLKIPLIHNVDAVILDEKNKVYLIHDNIVLYKNKVHGSYLSLLPYTDQETVVTLSGFKYPLEKGHLFLGDSLGISNEIVDEVATIRVHSGIVLVVESND